MKKTQQVTGRVRLCMGVVLMVTSWCSVGCQSRQVIRAQLAHCPTGYVWKDIVRRAPYLVNRMQRLHREIGTRLVIARRQGARFQVSCLESQWTESQSLLTLAARYNKQLQDSIWADRRKLMASQYAKLAIVDARQRKMAVRAAHCQGKDRYESADKRTVVEVTPAPCP